MAAKSAKKYMETFNVFSAMFCSVRLVESVGFASSMFSDVGHFQSHSNTLRSFLVSREKFGKEQLRVVLLCVLYKFNCQSA